MSRYFRQNPFAGEFMIVCGLATVIDFLSAFHFDETEIEYLALQQGNNGKPLFSALFSTISAVCAGLATSTQFPRER